MHAGMSEGPTGFTASSSYEKHFHFVLALLNFTQWYEYCIAKIKCSERKVERAKLKDNTLNIFSLIRYIYFGKKEN